MNQPEFVAITCNLLKAREKSRVQGASSWKPGPNLKSPCKWQHSLPTHAFSTVSTEFEGGLLFIYLFVWAGWGSGNY